MTTTATKTGYLELIIGPMFSGKTSRIVELYKQCLFCNIPVVVFNHSIDNRYDDELLSTHDKVKIPCIKIDNLTEIINGPNLTQYSITQNIDEYNNNIKSYIESDVILINEGQFFGDLYECVVSMLNSGKKIYICGLDGDFERKKFGPILDLIPLCDKVNKLTSLCSICKNGTPGIFSMRITNEKEQTVVGAENYIPVCRNCYDKKGN
jgi:thymidine kinase